MNPSFGNSFFREKMASVPNKFRARVIEEWSPTPFMTDVQFGDRSTDDEIMRWVRIHFGPESSPMHGKTGSWKRAAVTANGWSWIGFRSEDLLNRFLADLPSILTAPCAPAA